MLVSRVSECELALDTIIFLFFLVNMCAIKLCDIIDSVPQTEALGPPRYILGLFREAVVNLREAPAPLL